MSKTDVNVFNFLTSTLSLLLWAFHSPLSLSLSLIHSVHLFFSFALFSSLFHTDYLSMLSICLCLNYPCFLYLCVCVFLKYYLPLCLSLSLSLSKCNTLSLCFSLYLEKAQTSGTLSKAASDTLTTKFKWCQDLISDSTL